MMMQPQEAKGDDRVIGVVSSINDEHYETKDSTENNNTTVNTTVNKIEIDPSTGSRFTQQRSTMQDINDISHFLHLDLPFPQKCNMSMELNPNKTDASGRHVLMIKHLSPECGCTKEIQKAAHTVPTTSLPSMSTECRSVLTHFAWGAGCHSMVNVYHTTCSRYNQDNKDSKTKNKDGKNKNGKNKDGNDGKESINDKNMNAMDPTRSPSPGDIAMFLTNKMPSFNRACNYLSQLIHFRCISQTTLSSTAFTAEIAAKAGKLVQPTGPQHLPRSIRELLTMNMTTLVNGMT
jgi:hypothetical protein